MVISQKLKNNEKKIGVFCSENLQEFSLSTEDLNQVDQADKNLDQK